MEGSDAMHRCSNACITRNKSSNMKTVLMTMILTVQDALKCEDIEYKVFNVNCIEDIKLNKNSIFVCIERKKR